MRSGHRVARALLSTLASGIGSLALRLISIALLSRLIPPEQFGHFFLGQSMALLASVAGNLSFAYYVMEMPALTMGALLRSLLLGFGTTLLMLLPIGLGFELVAPSYLLALFGLSGIVTIAAAPSMSALRTAEALARRRLDFRALAWAEIWANLIGFLAVAPFLALVGQTGAALPAGQWVYVLAKLGLVLVYSARGLPHRFPGSAPTPSRTARLTAFGGELLDLVSVHCLRLIVGAVFGPAVVALWGRASQLVLLGVQLLLQPIALVVVPLGLQDGQRRRHLTEGLPAALDSAAVLLVPMAVSIFIMSQEITLLLLGQDWLASQAYLQAFSLLVVGRTVQRVFGILGRATQSSGRRLAIDAAALLGYCAVFCALLPFGPLAAAWAFSIWCCLTTLVHFAIDQERKGFSRLPWRYLGCLSLLGSMCMVFYFAGGSNASTLQKVAILLAAWVAYGLILVAAARLDRPLLTSAPFRQLLHRVESQTIS